MVSVLSGIILIPWVIKPLYGFISDTYPIFNRRRVPYFFIFGFTGFMSWISLAAFASGVVETVACLFGASLSLAFVNVLAEALIVEKGAENKKDHASTKAKISRLMTLYWGTESVCVACPVSLGPLTAADRVPSRKLADSLTLHLSVQAAKIVAGFSSGFLLTMITYVSVLHHLTSCLDEALTSQLTS